MLFYLYAVATLAMFMRRTVASSAYTLKQETLVLERKLGDSTTSVVEIPLDRILGRSSGLQGRAAARVLSSGDGD